MIPGTLALVSAIGTALNGIYAWPQVARAARTTAGLAAGTVLLGCTSRLAWICYAVGTHDLGLLAGQIPPALAFLTLTVLVIVREPARRTRVVTSLALLGVTTLAAVSYPPLLVTVAVATAAVTPVPQLFAPLTPGAATGVSRQTYVLAAAASVTWLGYGLLTANPTVYLTHALILPTSMLIAIRAARNRDQDA